MPAPTTPLWLKLALAAALLGGMAWCFADRADRLGNERRLSAVASVIAGRDVKVRCPGPIRRVLGDEQVEGWVRFDADGRPADETRLRKTACAELDALAEGRRRGRADLALAEAVDTVTHESFHLRGIRDEAQTECASLQTMAQTAQRLGAPAAQAAALARLERTEVYPRMGEAYRSATCPA